MCINTMYYILQHFFDIELCRRKFTMTRLGGLLRNFRRKMYATFIQPNLNKPAKLAKVPRQYRTLVEQADWDRFVAHTQTDKFKVVIF